jgi:hypothetical protein
MASHPVDDFGIIRCRRWSCRDQRFSRRIFVDSGWGDGQGSVPDLQK